MDKYKVEYVNNCTAAATEAGHIYPPYAACEAALESGFGTSALSIKDHNEFGTKQHVHPVFGTHMLPTREFLHGGWEVVNAAWVRYPTERDCFIDRMNTLRRLAPMYAHYAAALAATTGEEYVRQVSQSWSTDPLRAQKVLIIHGLMFPPSTAGGHAVTPA